MPVVLIECNRAENANFNETTQSDFRMKRRRRISHTAPETQTSHRESRWCEKHGYFIDVEACVARSANVPHCRRCLLRWRQLSLPL